jgi:tRNA modification GTPase
MPFGSTDTPFDSIFALSSPPGLGERGVVRLSGPRAFEIASALVGETLCLKRGVFRKKLFLSNNPKGPVLPALLLCFPGPASFTGEDVVEIHVLSSPSIMALVGEALVRLGLRSAWPGEFSRRAFTNGKMDLSQAEGIMALIRARDQVEIALASSAMREGAGASSLRIREGLLDLLGLLEAGMDFEEGETGGVGPKDWLPKLEVQRERLRSIEPGRRLLSDRFALPSILVLGPPNAGKTSLCNALADSSDRMPKGLVADFEGTTRDVRWMLCGGGRYRLGDSPGRTPESGKKGEWGESDQERRILAREIQAADAWIWVTPVERMLPPPEELGVPFCWVISKVDLWEPGGAEKKGFPALPLKLRSLGGNSVQVSVREGRGLDVLEGCFREVGRSQAFEEEWSALLGGRLLAAGEALDRALELAEGGLPAEMVASEVQEAVACLQPEASRQIPEELLDRIFSSFCLGK